MEGVCGVLGVLGDGIRRGRSVDMIPRPEAALRSQPSTNSCQEHHPDSSDQEIENYFTTTTTRTAAAEAEAEPK